eukprot:SAG31_NODE_2615_length_5371_cov_89.477238_5_plen_524_part_00
MKVEQLNIGADSTSAATPDRLAEQQLQNHIAEGTTSMGQSAPALRVQSAVSERTGAEAEPALVASLATSDNSKDKPVALPPLLDTQPAPLPKHETTAAACDTDTSAADRTSTQTAEARLRDTILEQVTCPVCLGIVLPLYQCNNGHVICAQCQRDPRLNGTCPTCRESRSGLSSRARGLEELARPLCTPCRWAANGCQEMFGADTARLAHERQCSDQSVATLCQTLVGCTWTGPRWRHTEHLIKSHPDFVVDNTGRDIDPVLLRSTCIPAGGSSESLLAPVATPASTASDTVGISAGAADSICTAGASAAAGSDAQANASVQQVYLHRIPTRRTADPARQSSLAVCVDNQVVKMALIGCKRVRPFIYCCETIHLGDPATDHRPARNSVVDVCIGTLFPSRAVPLLEPRCSVTLEAVPPPTPEALAQKRRLVRKVVLRVSIKPPGAKTEITVLRMQSPSDHRTPLSLRHRPRASTNADDNAEEEDDERSWSGSEDSEYDESLETDETDETDESTSSVVNSMDDY